MGFGETVKLGNGEDAKVGDEVVLLPEFESLVDFPAYGVVRTIERMNIQTTDEPVVRVGVLWFGYGGLWVRHYLPSQLAMQSYPVESPKAPAADGIAGYKERRSTWVTVGEPEDEAERVKRTWEGDEARRVVQDILSAIPDDKPAVDPQHTLTQVMACLRGENPDVEPDEQLVRDVITEELTTRTVRIANEQQAQSDADNA